MPLSQRELDAAGVPIVFQREGSVVARVGPSSGQPLEADRIPLDGRHYVCAGEVILPGGRRLRAHFEIATHTFDFLDRDSVWVTLDGDLWYRIHEPELRATLGLSESEIFPYRWLPDRPLAYHDPGPYPMKWPEETG